MDASRIPVVVAAGQSIEREQIVDAVELAARAAEAALGSAAALRDRIDRLTMISVVFSPSSSDAASRLVSRLGLPEIEREMSSTGGNLPQWLVTRAATEIAEGRLGATLIAGAEATRSMRAADPNAEIMRDRRSKDVRKADPVVGPSMRNVMHAAEFAIGLYRPTEVYPLFENAAAHVAGRSFAEQRAYLGPLMASFSQVAAEHPFAWFREPFSAQQISEVSAANRLVAEPYPKRMNAFPNVDQGAAVIVTSLAIARELGLEERCLYVWSGANNTEVAAVMRPDLGDSPALRAASAGALGAAGIVADELTWIDLYSCFPIAVEVGADALGVALDDPRRLTVTGGLPFFGGPGNNYSMHAIATLHERMRECEGLAYLAANGGQLSKHSMGVYGSAPPPNGFRLADTAARQKQIEADARPVAVGAEGDANVVTSTIVYGRDGNPAGAPLIAEFDDGRRVVAAAADAALNEVGDESLIGRSVRVSGSPASYVVI